MECYGRGMITERDTEGIDLRFGSEDVFIEMTERIVSRTGFGIILAILRVAMWSSLGLKI
jgi:aldehyde:ferredoxin oxidoreductase